MTTRKNSAQEAVAAEPCQKSAYDLRLACREIFGTEHPMAVIGPLDTASETLFQLESLFDAIAADPKATIHIQRLSAIGAYLAASIGNYADVQHETLRDAVKNGGAA